VVKEETDEDVEEDIAPAAKRQKKVASGAIKKEKNIQEVEVKRDDTGGRRRSGRLVK
jgi:hypothetical protein